MVFVDYLRSFQVGSPVFILFSRRSSGHMQARLSGAFGNCSEGIDDNSLPTLNDFPTSQLSV